MADKKTQSIEKVDLNKFEAKDGVLTIITRQDEALEVNYDKAVKLEGTITAPGNYYAERKNELTPVIKKSHVKYSYRGLFITLVAVENNDINAEITGKLKKNPDIGTLKINTGDKLGVKELYNMLRKNKFFFADKSQCQALVERLSTTKATVEKNIETELNKGGGNQRNVYDTAVRGVEQMRFEASMPLYEGHEKVNFFVDINIDASSGDVLFWLESIDLLEMQIQDAINIMDGQLARFKDSGLVMIEQ